MRLFATRFRPLCRMLASPAATVSLALLSLAAGCGTGPSSSAPTPTSGPIPGESTTVAVQLSSAANGRLSQFTMSIQSISLTNQAGKTTTIFNTPTNVDFIPANGAAYPLATVQVPQDVYTSAAVTISSPGFVYTFLDATGSINIDHGAYTVAPPASVVVLSAPITVEGTAMGLILSLDVSKSLTISDPTHPAATTNTGTPTFDLTAFPLTVEATTPLNGRCIGLSGQVTALTANSITVTLAGDGSISVANNVVGGYATGTTFPAALTSSTQFQGIASAAALAVGTFINVDLALSPDGSYTATRIEVQDPTTTNVTAGQVLQSNPANEGFGPLTSQYQGAQLETYHFGDTQYFVYAASTKFQASARFANLGALPFNPIFSGANLAAGQLTSIAAASYPTSGGTWALPTTVTLLPQTVDAVISGVSTSGSDTVYTVQLAPYDLIAQMNGPVAGTTDLLLPNASMVTVYVGTGTSLLNAAPLTAGATFRFNGLLFNDAGTLRMVADQVNDGVPQ